MREISLHILDIVQNSIKAQAKHIAIIIKEIPREDRLVITVIDNGIGMDGETLSKAVDPFMTTRTARRVGLGLSLFKASAESCNGNFYISSRLAMGTVVKAVYQMSHIDRLPLGDMIQTLLSLIVCNPDIDFSYKHSVGKKHFVFDTRKIKESITPVPIDQPNVIEWIEGYLKEGIVSLNGGA